MYYKQGLFAFHFLNLRARFPSSQSCSRYLLKLHLNEEKFIQQLNVVVNLIKRVHKFNMKF